MRGWVVNATPRRLYPPGMIRYPLYRRLGGPQGRSGRVRKTSPPPGFDPQTVQPVVSRYTGCAIPAHNYITIALSKFKFVGEKVKAIRNQNYSC